MDERKIKEALSAMKSRVKTKGTCPDETDLCRFVEGSMEEKETERVEKHLISCPTCCDYVVSLNKVLHFPEEERLPEVPEEQIGRAADLVQARKQEKNEEALLTKSIVNRLEELVQFIKECFTFEWIAQPIPVAVRSGVAAFALLLICTATYLYYQQSGPLGVQMEIMGKTREVTRGVPTGKTIERFVKEGDTLFSDDYCRINFELDQDAYAYVLYLDSSGTLQQLYPDPTTVVSQKVKAKTQYTIPTGEDQWFQLDEKPGEETVFIVASDKPVSDLQSFYSSIQGLTKDDVLKALKKKARVLEVLSFNHQ